MEGANLPVLKFRYPLETAFRVDSKDDFDLKALGDRRAVAPPPDKKHWLRFVHVREGKQGVQALTPWNPGRARFQRPLTAAKETHGEVREMTMTNRHSGRISTMHNTVIRFAIGAIVVIVASLAGRAPAMAQTSDTNSPPPSSNTQSQTLAPTAGNTEQPGEAKVVNKPSFFFPDLAYNGQPLTSGGKFRLAILNSVSPAAFLGSGFAAGIGQAADSPSGYGQGAEGYGKRFGASMATGASSNLIGTYLLSSVMHDDPRYFVMGDGSLKQSIKYALRRVVIVRKDDGGETFNWPGVIAPLAAAGLANTYMPDAQRTVGYTFESYGWYLAGSAGVNLLKEYWPTITRKILVPMGMSHDPNKP